MSNKFATCRVCGSAEMVEASTQKCPGCGTPYPKEPLTTDPGLGYAMAFAYWARQFKHEAGWNCPPCRWKWMELNP